MLQLKIDISITDYDEFNKFAIPLLPINCLKKIVAKFIYTGRKLLDDILEKFEDGKDEICEKAEDLLQEKFDVHIKFNEINLDNEGDDLKVSIEISEVNYNSVVSLYPLVKNKLEEVKKTGAILKLLDEYVVNMTQAALGALPEDKKDHLVACIIKQFKNDFISVFNKTLQYYDSGMELTDLSVENTKLQKTTMPLLYQNVKAIFS